MATNPEFKYHLSETDVTKEGGVVQMVQDTMKTFGRIDYAANIAGVSAGPQPITQSPLM